MTIKINTALDHIEKSLVSNRSAQFSLPSIVRDDIQPTIDAKGWQTLVRPESELVIVAGATSNSQTTFVPDDEMHYVIAAEADHSDGAAAHDLSIVMVIEGDLQVMYTDTLSRTSGQRITINRPCLLGPGSSMLVNSLVAIPVASNLEIQILFVRLTLGEYLQASPYG